MGGLLQHRRVSRCACKASSIRRKITLPRVTCALCTYDRYKTRQPGGVTEVEHEACAACGFDGTTYNDSSLLVAIGELGPRWRVLLTEAGDELRVRPSPETWSALEYAAHSRDITAIHVFGVEQALTQDEPVYPAIDGDALIESAATGYQDEDPKLVVDQLDTEACRLRDLAAVAGAGSWDRGITIGNARSTVRRLLEHALHDSLHHLDDVQRGLVRLRS